jgi:hypothetical protein
LYIFKSIGGALSATSIVWGTFAFAVQPLEVKSVVVNDAVAPIELMIFGENFMNGSDLELWLGENIPLTIKPGTLTNTSLTAVLPAGDFEGSFQLIVSTGGGSVGRQDLRAIQGNRGLRERKVILANRDRRDRTGTTAWRLRSVLRSNRWAPPLLAARQWPRYPKATRVIKEIPGPRVRTESMARLEQRVPQVLQVQRVTRVHRAFKVNPGYKDYRDRQVRRGNEDCRVKKATREIWSWQETFVRMESFYGDSMRPGVSCVVLLCWATRLLHRQSPLHRQNLLLPALSESNLSPSAVPTAPGAHRSI